MKGLLFTYLMTYGGSVVALFSPFHGLLVYVAFAILRPPSLWFWSVPPGNYSRTIAIAMLIGWAIRGFGNWKLGRGGAIVWAFIAYYLWAVLSGATVASNSDVAWNFVEFMAKILLPFLVGVSTIDSVAKLRQLAWTIVLSQGYVALELNRSYLDGYNWALDGFGGMGRAVFGAGLVCTLAISYFLILSTDRLWKKGVALFCTLAIAHVVFLTFSRGAILGLITGGAVAFIITPKRPWHYVAFAIALAVALRMAGPEIRERFSTVFAEEEERDASAQGRVELWKNCLVLIQESPVLGVGPDHFPLHSQRFGWPIRKEAHSLWLQTGAEIGIPGMLFLMLFYILAVTRTRGLVRERGSPDREFLRWTACMVISGIAGFAVAGIFVTIEALEVPYYTVLLGVAALKLQARMPTESGPPMTVRQVAPAVPPHRTPELQLHRW